MSESDQQPARGNSLKARIDRALPGPAASFFRPGKSPTQEPAPGLVVGKVIGDFKLIGLIGQGGMGQVWEAEQISLGGRRLAVKFMRPERITDRQRAYFEREARAGARLSHRGIVTVYGSGETDGQPWIAMELVPGNWNLRDLLDNLAAEGQVPAEYDQQVAIFFHELACALHVAHEGGVIHRDLKPQNILITPEGSPKVTDFGLARIAEETALSATGDLAGTYFYMSPEQVTARRANIDHRSDIFSLGVLLYEMLALVRPFQGDTGHQVAQQIVSKDPPGLHTIRSRIPHDLVVITGKCLEKDPGKRYADTEELAEDLRRYLSDEPILATPPTRLDRVVKTYRRHPARVLAGAVGAVAFVVISGMSLSLSKSNTALAHSNEQLQTKTVEALASEQLAIERASQVLRLSLSFDHKRLMAQARTLWPAYPQRVPDLEQWLTGARELSNQLPELRETRQVLSNDSSSAMAGPQRDWWLGQLGQLIERIESLENAETGQLSPGAVDSVDGWSVARRLAFAHDLALRMAPGGSFSERWEEALPAIAADYPGLDLAPQMGLVPIGKNADSGLWEFWHPQSGTEPKPDADGLLELTEESGFVFVLVPEGKFQMGSSKKREHESYFLTAALDEKPIHEVELSAFFLSKYEVSQAQWLRVTGHNPSMRSPSTHDYMDSLLCAVESVSWLDAVRHLRCFGLCLPSEAQWEYACRANSPSPWPGPREDLALFANLRDQNYQERYNDYPSGMSWNDGFSAQAPIGSFLANEFGLHDMIGNLWEWCHDAYDPQFYEKSPARDPVNQPVGNENRVERGGGYFSADNIARCSYRFNLPPAYADHGIGFRAARVIER